MQPPKPSPDRRIAETPDPFALATVEDPPFDLLAMEYLRCGGELGIDGARAIITDIWRLTRNPRLLEIEQDARGFPESDLYLTAIAAEHTRDGVLDPTAAARDFIETVRTDHPELLAKGPGVYWGGWNMGVGNRPTSAEL